MVHEKSLVIIPTRSHHYGKFCQISFRNYKVIFLNTGWYLNKSIIVPIHWWSPLQYVYLVQFGVYYLLSLWLCSDSQYQSVVPSEINLNFTGMNFKVFCWICWQIRKGCFRIEGQKQHNYNFQSPFSISKIGGKRRQTFIVDIFW